MSAKLLRPGHCGSFKAGLIIVTVLFTASSVRVDRRGTCSIGSRGAAAIARAGSRRRYQARSLGATWRSALVALGPGAVARVEAAPWPSPAETFARTTATNTGIRLVSAKKYSS